MTNPDVNPNYASEVIDARNRFNNAANDVAYGNGASASKEISESLPKAA
jgi:hypothetical protein